MDVKSAFLYETIKEEVYVTNHQDLKILAIQIKFTKWSRYFMGCIKLQEHGNLKEVRTLRYLSLVVPLKKVGDEAIHKELGDRIERVATTASSLEVDQDSASSSTSENGEIKITATIDGRVKFVTEASIKRHPKLEDSEGISNLPNTKIFKQLDLIGTFNFSKMIFGGMLKNLDNKSKFLMYPRFIQIFLNKHKRLLKPYKSTYVAPTLTQKLFSNMRMASKGYPGVDVLLFLTMLVYGPILQSDPTILPPSILSPLRAPIPLHDSPLLGGNTPGSEEERMTLNELTILCTSLSKKVESLESDLKHIKRTCGAAYSKLIMKVKKLENKLKSSKARRRVKFIISKDEDDLKDPSKQGRKIAQIDKDKGITLVQMDISTANVPVTTTGAEISIVGLKDKTAETSDDSDDITLAETLIEIRRSATKPQKVKGVAFRDVEETPNVDHELVARLTYKEQEQFAIKEMAKLLAEFFESRKKQLAAERSEAIRNKPPTRTQVRNRMITYLKHIVKSNKKRQREVSDEESFKKQKLEEDNDAKKEELRVILNIVPSDDIAINVESLATKYPIVDWKTYILTENMMYYQIIKADGSSKNYEIFSEMLNDFDRQDVIDLHRLIQERYDTTSPEGYDLLL
nr:hypothetical protein [Tanacetum cinerariifolium]